MKKILALVMAMTMGMGLVACGSSTSADTAAADTTTETTESTDAAADTTAADGDASYLIGICQLVQHPALDAATQGFKDALTEEFGDAVQFDEQNAQGDSNTCSTIINSFVSEGTDLILANATAALQAAQAGTSDIPVLGTSVTEYGVALGIDDFNGLFPDSKNVGLLYCTAEANSQYQVDTVQAALEKLGYTCTQYGFSDSNDLSSVATTAADASDVLYVPTDNTVANNTELVNNICEPKKVPIIAGEEGICSGCGVATLSIDYYDLGVATGKMAVQVLKGEANISEMPIEYAPQFTKEYDADRCEALGITVPDDYVAIEAE